MEVGLDIGTARQLVAFACFVGSDGKNIGERKRMPVLSH